MEITEDRPGKRAGVEMKVMEGGMPGVEDRDGRPNLTECRGVDSRELACSTVNCPYLCDSLLSVREGGARKMDLER